MRGCEGWRRLAIVNRLGHLLTDARQALAAAPFAPERREATLILAHVLGLSEAQVIARGSQIVSEQEASTFRALLARRLRGEPVAYLFGEREFYGRSFQVDRRVLIPRPETEHLVEAALVLALPATPRIVDVGTGSGCIALTLALEYPNARVTATDYSFQALDVAAENRRRLGARAALLQADLLAGIDLTSIDLLVSNPPYVDPAEAPRLSTEVTGWEPHAALFAPGGGRSLLERLLDAAAHMRSGTPTLLEIGYDQADWLQNAIAQQPRLRLERIIDDYGGIPRTAQLRTVNAPSTTIQ